MTVDAADQHDPHDRKHAGGTIPTDGPGLLALFEQLTGCRPTSVTISDPPQQQPKGDSFYRRAIAELEQAAAKGLMHIAAYDRHGYPMYALTDAGRRIVEEARQK